MEINEKKWLIFLASQHTNPPSRLLEPVPTQCESKLEQFLGIFSFAKNNSNSCSKHSEWKQNSFPAFYDIHFHIPNNAILTLWSQPRSSGWGTSSEFGGLIALMFKDLSSIPSTACTWDTSPTSNTAFMAIVGPCISGTSNKMLPGSAKTTIWTMLLKLSPLRPA